ncbi:uncharacterized protein ttc24 [Polymixia lowei]
MASDSSLSHREKKRKEQKVKLRTVDPELPEVRVAIEELTGRGHVSLQKGQREEALSCFKKALKASLELQDTRAWRACAFNLGAAYVEAGEPQKGLDLLNRAQPGERGSRVADLQFNLAVAHQALGQSSEAAGCFVQAAQLYRSQGDGASEGDTCMKMAQCYVLLQDRTQSVQSFLRAGESYRVAGRLDSAASALKEAGSHMVQSDQFSMDDITSVLTECLELSDSVTDLRTLGDMLLSLGVCYSQLNQFQEAVGCYQKALDLAPASPRPAHLATVMQNLGATLNSLGQYRQARGYHLQAAGLYGSLGRRQAQGRCFSNLGVACSELGEAEGAAESYLHALQAFKDTEDYQGQSQACEGLGEAYMKMSEVQKSTRYFQQALAALTLCSDSSIQVQERLVNRLTAALQQRLSLSPPDRLQRGPRPHRPRPHRPHPPNFPHTQPGSNQSEWSSQSPAVWEEPADPQQMYEEESETSLAQDSENLPTGPADNNEATPRLRKWTSRLCVVM